jgi:hypothetical protein
MKVIETEGFKEDMRRLFSDEPKYVLRRWWGFISRDMWMKIKWFIQRGMRGYADEDWWDLGDYLASWMPKALRDMKRNVHSHPIDDEVNTVKEWEAVLEKIARGFEAKRKQDELTWDKKRTEHFKRNWNKLQKEFEEGMKLFIKFYDNLWD